MPDADSPTAVARDATIRNADGLHFRPIMQFVDLCTRFRAKVTVEYDGRSADGCSPMELLMLVATKGAQIKISAAGDDAQDAVAQLVNLVESGFGEP